MICRVVTYVKVKDDGGLSFGFRCQHHPSKRYSTRALRRQAIQLHQLHLGELRKKS